MAPKRSFQRWNGAANRSVMLIALVLVVATFACIIGDAHAHKEEQDDVVATTPNQPLRRRQTSQEQGAAARPVMHTFFSRQESKSEKGDKVDDEMLEVWKSSWAAAGWEPKVLTLEDAKKHPQFDRVQESLQGLPLDEYNRLCFLRWLAMAANGGGWMSDYDTFPLHPIAERTLLPATTPNEGRFSVYDHVVPSLVSGSAQEWDRMARSLVENAVQHKNEDFWSDMFAMVDLFEQHDPQVFVSTRRVEIGSHVLTGKHFGDQDCAKLVGKVAIHFSHSSIHWANKANTLREGEGLADRPRIASHFLKIFEERCTKEQVAVSGPTTTIATTTFPRAW